MLDVVAALGRTAWKQEKKKKRNCAIWSDRMEEIALSTSSAWWVGPGRGKGGKKKKVFILLGLPWGIQEGEEKMINMLRPSFRAAAKKKRGQRKGGKEKGEKAQHQREGGGKEGRGDAFLMTDRIFFLDSGMKPQKGEKRGKKKIPRML